MKFLVPNYSCLQNPWLGATAPSSLFSLSSTEFVEPPPQTKFLGTPLYGSFPDGQVEWFEGDAEGFNTVVHIFLKNVGGTSEFQVPEGYLKYVPYRGSAYIRCHCTKFSCRGNLALGDLCTPRTFSCDLILVRDGITYWEVWGMIVVQNIRYDDWDMHSVQRRSSKNRSCFIINGLWYHL